MPIEDTDIPIIDNQTDFKIDNQVERIYIYRARRTSVGGLTPSVDNLRFYKAPEKYNNFDVFISENGVYYIWAFVAGTLGYWVLSTRKGLTGLGIPNSGTDPNFVNNLPSPEKTFSASGPVTIVISKITTDVISQ